MSPSAGGWHAAKLSVATASRQHQLPPHILLPAAIFSGRMTQNVAPLARRADDADRAAEQGDQFF